MDIAKSIIDFVKSIFSWWVIVTPWEQCVFVRCGKHAKVLKGGIYLRIPFIDQVFVQSVRLRTIDLPIQTITTNKGIAITVKAMIGYSIKDIFKLYNTISHPDLTLAGIVMGSIARQISQKNNIDIKSIEDEAIKDISSDKYGIGDVFIQITSWAEVKTYRLIQDQSCMWEGANMNEKK